MMKDERSPLQILRERLRSGGATPRQLAEEALGKANSNAGSNVYLALDPEWTLQEAKRVEESEAAVEGSLFFGLPVSLKDCFDLEGFTTTVGTRFYAERNAQAERDAVVTARLRRQGAVIVGKTNLHPLAYGITGENPDFGDCVQPANRSLLTGGSTSGGAASVQEGSAVAAIGTDTGGSIRVPAALCGLAGYRASIGLAWDRKLWSGGVHLAQSFDTLGWIFADLRDAPPLAQGLFGLSVPQHAFSGVRIATISGEFLHDCEANVLAAFDACKTMLIHSGAAIHEFNPLTWPLSWEEALSIYAPIQAHEAAAIHAEATGGDYTVFPAPISERLARGASLSFDEIARQRERHEAFRAHVDDLLAAADFLLMPCSPLCRLGAGADHSETRTRILRYTTPLSLAGTPVVTIPFPGGAGMQLAAPRGKDARLLAYAASLAYKRQSAE